MSSDKYVIDPMFEREVLYCCIFKKGFFSAIDKAIEIECFLSPTTIFLVGLCKSYFDRTSTTFTTHAAIRQEIVDLYRSGGKITIDQASEYLSYVDDLVDIPQRDVATILDQFKKVLEPRLTFSAIEASLTGTSRVEVISRLQIVDSIGIAASGVGEQLGMSSFAGIAALRSASKSPTGSHDVDTFLRGGLRRGTVTTIIGGTGDGKSMYLGQIAATMAMNNGVVCIGTNELPIPELQARIIGDITDIPYTEILDGRDAEAKRRFSERQSTKFPKGRMFFQDLPVGHTTVGHMRDWGNEVQQQTGRPITGFVFDYGDKFTAEGKASQLPAHELFRIVWEEYCELAADFGCPVVVGSQAKDKGAAPLRTTDHYTQSKWKMNLSHVVLSLNKTPKGYFINVAKNRSGAEGAIGPIEIEPQFGRLTARKGMTPTQAQQVWMAPNSTLLQIPGQPPFKS